MCWAQIGLGSVSYTHLFRVLDFVGFAAEFLADLVNLGGAFLVRVHFGEKFLLVLGQVGFLLPELVGVFGEGGFFQFGLVEKSLSLPLAGGEGLFALGEGALAGIELGRRNGVRVGGFRLGRVEF